MEEDTQSPMNQKLTLKSFLVNPSELFLSKKEEPEFEVAMILSHEYISDTQFCFEDMHAQSSPKIMDLSENDLKNDDLKNWQNEENSDQTVTPASSLANVVIEINRSDDKSSEAVKISHEIKKVNINEVSSTSKSIGNLPVSGRKRQWFTRVQKCYLNRWYQEHSNHPYITKDDAQKLSAKLGLGEKQIKTYISNKRIREKAFKIEIEGL